MCAAPIIIMSFNRPQYLEPTLDSLLNQRDRSLDGREIHLFQDGAVNRYSKIRYARDSDIDESVALFQQKFPEGIVHRSTDNIGIFENFQRAENYCFRDRDFDCAYFFEDDLILSPVYLDVLDELRDWATSQGNIAYFAAYGNYYADQDELDQHKNELMNLDHHWAFGLFRSPWQQIQIVLSEYKTVVEATDYSRRDHQRILSIYESMELSPRASSQDAAKAVACCKLGLWRANTYTPFARYIGTTGQHMTPEQFEELGFDRTIVSNENLALKLPSEDEIRRHLHEQMMLFELIRLNEYSNIVAGLPPRNFNPLRMCSRQEVEYGYRLFLNRVPEDEAIFTQLTGNHSVFDFVNGLANSQEYLHIISGERSHLATRDDIVYAYRLILHRDPDGEQIFAEHVGVTDARSLAAAIWNDPFRRDLWNSIER